MTVVDRVGRVLSGYPELGTVIVAAAAGLALPAPFSWLVAHEGINILLVVLVLATALTIDPSSLRSLPRAWPSLLAALLVGVTVLPALSWAASRIVAAGSLRNGVMIVGLAPCEIASVATTTMAGGAAVVSAGVLIGSTVATLVVAGPILGLEAGHASIHPAHIVVNLALVVALPLAVGLVVRALRPGVQRAERPATLTATLAVAVLVALIASEVHLSVRYLAVLAALLAFLAATAAIGWLVGRGTNRPTASALLLTTSMRDFAIAAGLASAAFGAAASAPLGVYGIVVLVWGTAVAGLLRRRGRMSP